MPAILCLLKDKSLLLKFTPKGVESFPAGFKDKNGFYFGMRATLSVIAYNPKIVSEKDAPQTWKELLNPKWSGKLVSAHPGYSGIIMTHVLALVNVYGWEYFRDLAKNKLHLVQSANDPAGVVASGERPVGVNGAEYFYYKTLKQGNPIKIVYPKEGVPLVVSPVAIAKDAPHPNAAKLFTRVYFYQRVPAIVGGQRRTVYGSSRSHLSSGQTQAQRFEAALGRCRRAGKA